MTYQEKVIKLMDAKREMFEDWRYFTLEDRLNVYRIPEVDCLEFWEDLRAYRCPSSGFSCIFCRLYHDENLEDEKDENNNDIGGCCNCPYAKTHLYCDNEYSLWKQVWGAKYKGSIIGKIVSDIEEGKI